MGGYKIRIYIMGYLFTNTQLQQSNSTQQQNTVLNTGFGHGSENGVSSVTCVSADATQPRVPSSMVPVSVSYIGDDENDEDRRVLRSPAQRAF
jgi:hypothetical protein